MKGRWLLPPLSIMSTYKPAELYANLLNTAPEFWQIYDGSTVPGRRRKLMELFKKYPGAQLPVNNRYQANTIDKDLQILLNRGILKRIRSGVGKQHYMAKSSAKRQTYLVLA